ncbi:MAG: tetratricopeptide repeat protein [Christensenellales bacterium]
MEEKKFECKSCSNEPSGKINVSRVVNKLDECFAKNDLAEAVRTVEYWENEARSLNDFCGLLSVLNEELGLYRTLNDEAKGMRAVRLALEILAEDDSLSRATVYVNVATTLKAFGRAEEGLPYYDKAEQSYLKHGFQNTYEHAALLNNKGTALSDLARYDEAEKCFIDAINILKEEGNHDADIAISVLSLAYIVFEREENYDKVEQMLDVAWDYLNSERQPHDFNYAAAIKKCVPSLRYFQRGMEADALEETANEIYSRG